MNLIYNEKNIVVASLNSNSENGLPVSNFQALYPTSSLSCCSFCVPSDISVTGSKIEFYSGVPYRLVRGETVLFEIDKKELEEILINKQREAFQKQCERFPCISSGVETSSFIDRLSRDRLTTPEISLQLRNGTFFDRRVFKVGWWGCFTDAGGYANMNREIVRRLHNHYIIPYIRVYSTVNQVEPQMCDMIKMYSSLSPKKGDHPFVYSYTPMSHEYHGGKRIFFTMMETASLHPVFMNHCNKYSDEVWVPSKSNRDIFSSCGVRKAIKVVPLGIDERLYFGDSSGKRNLDALIGIYGRSPAHGVARFKFLNVVQWNYRKGYDALIRGFVNAFDASDDVCLVIATQYPSEVVKRDLDQFIPRTDNLPQVLLYNHIVPTVDMPAFYRNFDCYVHLSRGEGFSLTQIEAAACGLPVISCFHSGMTEYLTRENSFPIDCPDLERCSSRLSAVCFFYQDQMLWKLGDHQVDQCTDYMRYVVENYDEAQRRASVFLQDVKQKYTWDKTVERVAELLKT